MNPTRQEAFNLAAKHLLTTRAPSFSGAYFSFVYSGTGCALRPFIPEGADPKHWDNMGAIGAFPRQEIPNFISNDLKFYERLQVAHDSSAIGAKGDPAKWLVFWKDKMRAVAEAYELDASILDEETAA